MAKHKTLASLFTDIAAAIRAKTGKTDKLVADDFPTAIAGITTGVNTSDATVTAADVASGVIAYGKDGKVTGTVTTVKSGSTRGYTADTIESASVARYVIGSKTLPADVLLRSGAIVQIRQRCSSFGDATAADVRSGKTFTSAAGFMVTGTYGDMGETIQYDFGDATRVSSTQLRLTITRDTKPTVLAWKIEASSWPTAGVDGMVLSGMGMRSSNGTESEKYRAINLVGDSSSAGKYTLDEWVFTTGIQVSANATGKWNITIKPGSDTVSADLTYTMHILTA